jgi:hypothetical protein
LPDSQASEISTRTAVTRRCKDSSLGKRPTTRLRRLIWLLRVSQAFNVRSFLRCESGRSKMVKLSGRFSSAQATSFGCLSRQVLRKTRSRTSAFDRDSALKMAAI